jgi:hypothetical protein
MSIGFTSNLSWRIPLKPDRMTVHQAITQDWLIRFSGHSPNLPNDNGDSGII